MIDLGDRDVHDTDGGFHGTIVTGKELSHGDQGTHLDRVADGCQRV